MKMWVDPPDIYLYRDAVDFRKSINGLVMVVEQGLGLPPFTEALYVFCNRGRDKPKLVYWDKTGFALWYKRLEKDKFKWPTHHPAPSLSLPAGQWQWLLPAYDVIGHHPIPYASAG